MIDVKIYSIIILVLSIIIILIGYGMIPLFRPPPQTVSDKLPTLIFFILIALIFAVAFVLIFTLVTPDVFINKTTKTPIVYTNPTLNLSRLQQSQTQTLQSQTTGRGSLPGIIPPGPTFDTRPQAPNFGGSTFFTSYYQFDPNDRTLKKLAIDKITDGTPISDYFHRNDESIFTLTDGTIVSILGDNIEKIRSSPPIQKIRILGNQYIGFSNGKLYLSSDLKNWREDTTKPSNIIDFDVPVNQNYILYIRTPKENILYDTKSNQVITTEPAEPKRFGSSVNSYVKYTPDAIIHNRDNQQTSYKGYIIGDVDNRDRLYIFPVKLNDDYTVKDIFTADNNVILKVDSFIQPQDQINVSNDVISR
jgi:hypothetical protein